MGAILTVVQPGQPPTDIHVQKRLHEQVNVEAAVKRTGCKLRLSRVSLSLIANYVYLNLPF